MNDFIARAQAAVGLQLLLDGGSSTQKARMAGAFAGVKPSGWDQASEIETYFRDIGSSPSGIDLGVGDFIIGRPIQIYARRKLSTGQGVGLTMKGAGPGTTRLLYTGDKTQSAITITDPDGTKVARRDYLTKASDFSFISCTAGGVPLSGRANLAGSALLAAPVVGLGYGGGHVLHTSIMERILFEGFQYCLTLDDVTLLKATNLWCRDFVEAVRIGGNFDIATIEHCMFGSEQYATDYRNDCAAVSTGYVGINGASFTGGSNNVTLDHCWLMKHGMGMLDRLTTGSTFRSVECYFEDMLQLYRNTQTAGRVKLSYENCHYSEVSDNDGPLPKVQLPPVQGCEARFKDCDGPESYGPIGGWIGFYENFGRVHWDNNSLGAGAGHVTYRKASEVVKFTGSIANSTLTASAIQSGALGVGLTISDDAGAITGGTKLLSNGAGGGTGGYPISVPHAGGVTSRAMTAFVALTIPDFGRHMVELAGPTGTFRVAGEQIKATNVGNFQTAGTVLARPEIVGTDLVFTTSGAVTTFDLPISSPLDGFEIKLTITAVSKDHAITFSSRFVFPVAFVQPTVDGTTTHLRLEQRRSKWIVVSGPNAWF